MVRASRSQLALSSGAVAAICPRTCRPLRKSLRLKAASASVRKLAPDLATAPASLLIWASSLIAESARSSRLKALSAACAVTRPSASTAQSVAARTKPIMMGLPADKRPRLKQKCAKGDGLVALERKRSNEKVVCDICQRAWPKSLLRRQPTAAEHCDGRAEGNGPPLKLCRRIAKKGSDGAWPESGFFILAML